jgi:hypothetical protein
MGCSPQFSFSRQRELQNKGNDVFGLPLETSLLVFGFPLLWIIYTAIFLFRSRDWENESVDEEV